MFKGWQYHFEMLNLTYLAYLMFGDVTRKLFPGISESAIGKMVAGAYVSMFRPEERALPPGPAGGFCGWRRQHSQAAQNPPPKRLPSCNNQTPAKTGWPNMKSQVIPGFTYPAAAVGIHHEGSWMTDPDIPYSYIKGYVERLEKGETIERSLDKIEKERDEVVAEYTQDDTNRRRPQSL